MIEATLSLVIIVCSPWRDLMGMTLMLGGRRCGGVSKTARSRRHRRHYRPRRPHLVAVGGHHRSIPHAIARRRLADDVPERAAEGPSAREADVEAYVGDAALGLTQQEHRTPHPPPLQDTAPGLPQGSGGAAYGGRPREAGQRGPSGAL